jgi:hypothetical protein
MAPPGERARRVRQPVQVASFRSGCFPGAMPGKPLDIVAFANLPGAQRLAAARFGSFGFRMRSLPVMAGSGAMNTAYRHQNENRNACEEQYGFHPESPVSRRADERNPCTRPLPLAKIKMSF